MKLQIILILIILIKNYLTRIIIEEHTILNEHNVLNLKKISQF